MVSSDEQRGGIAERLVVEQQPRIDVPVRRHDRQVADGVIQAPRDGALGRVHRKEPIAVQRERGIGGGHGAHSGRAGGPAQAVVCRSTGDLPTANRRVSGPWSRPVGRATTAASDSSPAYSS
jgi:hypothetical protein